MGRELDIPVVSGGDRHGWQANSVLNITRAETFPDFVQEIRSRRQSTLFTMPAHRESLLARTIETAEEAIRNYRAAIAIDDQFYPAKVNLAMLYNRYNENSQAEALLREVLDAYPDMHEVAYSLSLLLAEEKKYSEAAHFLERAAEGMPLRARLHYNLGLLLQKIQKDSKAEEALRAAIDLEPENMDFLYAMPHETCQDYHLILYIPHNQNSNTIQFLHQSHFLLRF